MATPPSWWGRSASSQIPRLKCGWLRLWFRFTGGRHCLLDGEGHSLPAPRAKPAGAPPHPWGFLPRIKSGVGGNPNPLAGEDRLSRELPSICLSVPLQCPIAGFGFLHPSFLPYTPGAQCPRFPFAPPPPAARTPRPARPASVAPAPPNGYSGRVGAWRSLVAHLLWEQGVGGSNPLAPTKLNPYIPVTFREPPSEASGPSPGGLRVNCRLAVRGRRRPP